MILIEILYFILCTAVVSVLANLVMLPISAVWLLLLIPLFLAVQFMPLFPIAARKIRTFKLRNTAAGSMLLKIFLLSTSIAIAFNIPAMMGKFEDSMDIPPITDEPLWWTFAIILIIGIESIVFWNGIIRVYVTGKQMSLLFRVTCAVCGLIPIVNLVLLGMLIRIADKEVKFENDKIILNEKRADQKICACKYPILLVHGVFFRDSNYFNYWGRVPEELEKNGAQVHYGNQQSAASVDSCGQELAERIKSLCEKCHCEKVNIIAHSKGGLDCRMAIAKYGAGPYVASLTTINTPHRGCEFADYLLSKIGENYQEKVASIYESTLRRMGDPNPSFLDAVNDLTSSACERLNEEMPYPDGIFCQSFGSKLNGATSGQFPLNFSTLLVGHFDGPNDGLVGEKSFAWGQEYQFITVKGKRGVSHGDVIDLNRENIDGYDVREFYVQLVSKLRIRGF